MAFDIHNLFGTGVNLDAYVATSEQHTENERNDVVSSQAVCDNLQGAGGFRGCFASLVHYNGTDFVSKTRQLGFQLVSNGLYPHRMLSYFSTVQRCMSMVSNASSLGEAIRNYSTVVVTRLDVISGLRTKAPGPSWWRHVDRFDLIAERKLGGTTRARLEDRLFFGQFPRY
jgi:hypothetical protein